jgi:thiamine biosynthesis protein ThiS
MNIQVNGECRSVGENTSLLDFLQQLGLPLEVLLVEHNGEALRREDWPNRSLQEADRLEIIRIVAGG